MIVRTNNIIDVYDNCKLLIEENKEILVFLDIDDTVLSTVIGQKLVDNNVKKLIELLYRYNPRCLYFLTARDSEYKRKTLNALNSAKLVHDDKFIQYNIIHSPYENGIATKGDRLKQFLTIINQPNWVIL
jgi:hypothetical protein